MKRRILSLIIVFAFIFPFGAFAEDAMMDDVEVALSPSFLVSFVVKNAFTRDIEEAIKSGAPTSFTFIVKITRLRNYWMDEHIGTWEFKHTVKYDSLKKEYEITLEEQDKHGLRTGDFEEMKRLMVSGEKVALTPAPVLKESQSYELRLMAELDTVKLPFNLQYMFFFVKLWDYETDWFISSFSP